jgi:hypothetical protein
MLSSYLDPIMGKLQLLGAIVEEGKVFLHLQSEQKEVLKLTPAQFEEYAIKYGVPF